MWGYLYPPGVFTVILAQLVLLPIMGGTCVEPGACVAAVDGTFVLPTQLLLMSVLVYRGSTARIRLVDVLNTMVASWFLSEADRYAHALRWIFRIPLVAFILYGQVSIALYMYHRFIFHAHWSARTTGIDRWLWNMVRANYAMHYFEHHQVSRTPADAARLAKLQKCLLTKEELQRKYKDDWLCVNFAGYTDRGITIQHPVGIMGAFMFFSILPTGTISLACYRRGDVVAALLHLAAAAAGMWQTMINHDKYHADEETMAEWAQTSRMGWLWRLPEMKRIAREHILHHDGKHHERYFSMLPFDCLFIFPLWPEEHMYDIIKSWIVTSLDCATSLVSAAGRLILDVASGHVHKLNIVIVVGLQVWLASSSWAACVALVFLHLLWSYAAYSAWTLSMNQDNRHARSDERCRSSPTKPRPVLKDDLTLVSTGDITVKDYPPVHKLWALDMDHIKVDFVDFLAAHYFIVPNAMLLWMSESFKLVARERLQGMGLVRPAPCDYARTVAKLCLDGMEALHYKRMYVDGASARRVAEFHWSDISYIKMDATVGRIQSFKILIDLDRKLMVDAWVDGCSISAKKAVILLWFETVFGNHVKIHAMANWGLSEEVLSLQLRWMSVCSTMYNYFGYTVFPRFITEFWYRMGLTKKCYSAIQEASRHSAESGVPMHANIRELRSFSPLVDFMCKVRSVFLKNFEKYQADFPGVDAEAMFVGTICHGLDHCMMDVNIEDALWLDTSDDEYGAMAELMRHVRVGFVPELPGLFFNHRYKHMSHPLFQNVYAYARRINPWFADRMDACIVK